jgi:hypothetical protein
VRFPILERRQHEEEVGVAGNNGPEEVTNRDTRFVRLTVFFETFFRLYRAS